MWLRKETGGATLHHGGKSYAWKGDGDVAEVPDLWGEELLAIRGGGFSEAQPPPPAPKPPAAKQAAPPKAEAKTAAPAAPAAKA